MQEFQKRTFDWIHSTSNAQELKKERDTLAEKLHQNYWALDPYIRARTLYDRQGVIQEGGKIDFYATAKSHASTGKSVASNGDMHQAPPPHNDDVD